MDDKGLTDELTTAATACAEHDPELIAAAAEIAGSESPPTGALSQAVAAAWLGIPRRTLRSLIERGRLHVAEDGRLYLSDLGEQLEILRSARKARRK